MRYMSETILPKTDFGTTPSYSCSEITVPVRSASEGTHEKTCASRMNNRFDDTYVGGRGGKVQYKYPCKGHEHPIHAVDDDCVRQF